MLERINHTLEDMACTMMCGSKVPQNFWVEVVNTASHVLNRCLIRPILKRTLYELFKGIDPTYLAFDLSDVNALLITMTKIIEENLMLEAMKEHSWDILCIVRHIGFTTNVIFDKSNDGESSDPIV